LQNSPFAPKSHSTDRLGFRTAKWLPELSCPLRRWRPGSGPGHPFGSPAAPRGHVECNSDTSSQDNRGSIWPGDLDRISGLPWTVDGLPSGCGRAAASSRSTVIAVNRCWGSNSSAFARLLGHTGIPECGGMPAKPLRTLSIDERSASIKEDLAALNDSHTSLNYIGVIEHPGAPLNLSESSVETEGHSVGSP